MSFPNANLEPFIIFNIRQTLTCVFFLVLRLLMERVSMLVFRILSHILAAFMLC